MSFEQDAWTAFVAQLKGDTALTALVGAQGLKFGFKEKIFSPANFPFVVITFAGTINEERIGNPKAKQVGLDALVSAKIKNTTTDEEQMIVDLLALEESVKNAMEKDLQLGSDASNLFVGDGDFSQLSDDIAEVTFNVEIKTNRFTMGSR